MNGRVCLVTGSTHGIGQVTAEALARMGATVVVHGRHPDRVDQVCRAIRERTTNQNVSGIAADFESLDDVRRLASAFLSKHRQLHVLVNNAGGGRSGYQKTKDGFEWHFGVNHLAPFLLTTRLLDTLVRTAPARIVVVSSAAHRRNPVKLDDLNFEREFRGFGAYGRSKFANVLFAVELARRLEGTGCTANALHPGFVRTNIFDNTTGVVKLIIRLFRPLMSSAEKGAQTTIYLATSPDVAATSGKYFVKCREEAPDPAVLDAELARRLWERSAALTA